ncbi:Rv2175c family DNA-binding protein [Nocardioides daejeonensis]|uniref:Rv2175c family DNA-binding protein n=1 Tax=Nocardioides daejeonensis TaxID=1046556 RepID=UPI000D74D690|nr:Rv2175c family DNA-binding protein [Nocardioides daejeonensis]
MNDSAPDLADLVPDWLDWSQAAQALGVSVNKLRTMLKDHQLATAAPRDGEGLKIPAQMIQDGVIVKGLPGLLTTFHDGGWSDRECIEWIFTDQDLPGRPIDALRENRGSEAKRRAQAIAL